MSLLYVAEYQYLAYAQGPAVGAGTEVPAGLEPSLAEYTISIGGSSQQGPALNPLTHFVRLHSDSVCSVAPFGTNPTATTSNKRMAANQTEFFGVDTNSLQAGQSMKIAVIANT